MAGVDGAGWCFTLPAGDAARLLDELLPTEAHYVAVAADDDPDLATT